MRDEEEPLTSAFSPLPTMLTDALEPVNISSVRGLPPDAIVPMAPRRGARKHVKIGKEEEDYEPSESECG